MRWEKEEGLPVRRHRQSGHSSVYAYPSELDAWREARMPRGSEAASASPLWKHPAVVLAAGVALVLGGLALFHERVLTPNDLLVEAADPRSGSSARQVWDGDASTGSVSSDGRYLTFTDWATGDLAVRDLETGENRRLTRKGTWNESEEFAEWSVISADGQQVAYSWRDENNFYHLRTIRFEGEGGGARSRVLIRADADTPYLIPTTWLPDGKRIACSVWRGDGTIDLVLVSADDGTVARLKSLEWRTSIFAAASLDGRFLAYDIQQSRDEDKSDIRLIAIDGSRDVPLIEQAGSDSVLAWAPDGSGLLFGSDRRGSNDVWFVPVQDGKATGRPQLVRSVAANMPLGLTRDGSFFYSVKLGGDDIYTTVLDPETFRLVGQPQKMDLEGESNIFPNFSPDGRRMAWLRRGAGTVRYQHLVVRDESGQEGEIPLPAPGVRGISWFPDGERVLGFGFDQKNRSAAFEIVVESGEVRKLFRFEHGGIMAIPVNDGRWIVFSGGDKSIFIRNVQGGEERPIAANVAMPRGFDVSPDGFMVAFLEGSPSEGLTLKVKALDPGAEARELARLPPGGRGEALSWSSDGQRVFFARSGRSGRRPNSEWWSIPVEGGSPTSTGLKVPGFGHHSRISMHPDGKRVVYSQAWGRGEVWVAENLLPAATAETE